MLPSCGSSTNIDCEVVQFSITGTEWTDVSLDFDAGLGSYGRIVLFTDFGDVGGGLSDTYLFDDIAIGATLSVNYNNITNVSIYPNPSSSNWNFKTANTVITSVDVYNIVGKRVVSQKNNSSSIAVSTQGLATGIYIARVTTPEGTQSMKLIKN